MSESRSSLRTGAAHRLRAVEPAGVRAGATGPARDPIATACLALEAAETAPSLAVLAAASGLSPFHFHRRFRATTGLTPRQYFAAVRARRVRERLADGSGVTDALHDAGYGSSGRFYGEADAVLGMTPTAYRTGGRGTRIEFAVAATSLGALLVARSARGLCALLLGDDPATLVRDLEDRFPAAELVGGEPGFETVVATVVGFVEQPRLGLSLPLDVQGTAFQQRVWQALLTVPAGETASYAEIAARIGAPRSMRAVAGACAANPLAVAIPCHRVVRQDGGLSGYRWGVERKRVLLERERGSPAATDIDEASRR